MQHSYICMTYIESIIQEVRIPQNELLDRCMRKHFIKKEMHEETIQQGKHVPFGKMISKDHEQNEKEGCLHMQERERERERGMVCHEQWSPVNDWLWLSLRGWILLLSCGSVFLLCLTLM